VQSKRIYLLPGAAENKPNVSMLLSPEQISPDENTNHESPNVNLNHKRTFTTLSGPFSCF